MASTPRINDIEKELFGNKVKTSFVDAPYTTIKNEQGNSRQIPDLENNLKVSMGVERVVFNSIKKLDKEFGPNGEPVHELNTKDARIRLVGNWINNSSTVGGGVITGTVGAYIEVTFYGTALNMLHAYDSDPIDVRASVDGGAEGSNIMASSATNIISIRKVNPNQIVPVVSGLSLGTHTVKIRLNSTHAFRVYGVEVSTNSSQLVINAGNALVGGDNNNKLAAQILMDYKPSDLIGYKGGRVVWYLDEDGNVGHSTQVVDPTVTEGDPTELVTNGTFDTDLSSWTNLARATWDSGRLKIDATVGSGARQAEQAITVVNGQKYTFSADYEGVVSGVDGTVQLDVYTGPNYTGTKLTSKVFPAGIGEAAVAFEAQGTTVYVIFTLPNNGDIGYFDNASVKETAYDFLATTDTDFSDEEIYRTINFREFGKDRGEDFSIPQASGTRAFTLDDGTTTLCGATITSNGAQDGFRVQEHIGYWKITFVGTGFAVSRVAHDLLGGASDADLTDIVVDGISVGVLPPLEAGKNVTPVCSGLPYGTHTIMFDLNGEGGRDVYYEDLIIYQPKKPTLPANSFELADYNVLADYVPRTDTSIYPAQGVIGKSALREFTYTGTWATPSVDPQFRNGFNVAINTDNGYVEHTFWGTGIEHNFYMSNSSGSYFDYTLDGNTDFTGINVEYVNEGGGATTWTPATGRLGGTASATSKYGVRLSIQDLPLGWHTLKIYETGGQLWVDSFDITTPIHINNTKVGSLSLADKREEEQIESESSNIDMSKAKAWFVYNTVGKILDSYNISAILPDTGQETFLYYFKKSFKNNPVGIITTTGGTNPYLRTGGLSKSTADPIDRSGGFIQDANVNYEHIVMAVFFGELEDEENIDLTEL